MVAPTMVAALSGKILSPLREFSARRVAVADFAGEGTISTAKLIYKGLI